MCLKFEHVRAAIYALIYAICLFLPVDANIEATFIIFQLLQ